MLRSALLRDASLRFAAEDRPAEASPPEVHPAEVRVAEVRTEEVGLGTPRVPGGYPLLKLSDVIIVRHRIMQGRGAEAQRDDDSPFCGPTPSSLTASGTPPSAPGCPAAPQKQGGRRPVRTGLSDMRRTQKIQLARPFEGYN